MGIIRYKDVPYGGGGSSVTPNPSGTATANLEKVQIESTVYAIKDSNAVHGSDKGTANGVASLDANGKVPSAQLPSYVDDVVEGYYDNVTDRFYEESTFTTVIPPEDGKSWVDVSSNKSYRWTGSVYVRVDEGVQLGETSNTAYRGDRGKTAYDHATESGKISSAVASGLYKIAATAEGHIASLTAAVKADFTALGLVDKSGDTMTGNLTVRADVIVNNDSNGGGHDLIIGHANASDSEQQCYIKFYRGQVSATTSLQAEQNINYDPDTGTFTPDANNYNILLPCKSGTIALISDIEALDGVITGSAGAGKTLTAFSQTDGKISATFGNISITKSQISDFPTIPTVYNSTITIKKNGTTVDSFTLNQSSAKNIDISVPTKTSELTNDSGFKTGTYAGSSSDGGAATQVDITDYNPTASTWQNPSFVGGGGGSHSVRTNNGLRYKTLEGTASAAGESILSLGNSTASGTAGNKTGYIRIYGSNAGYALLKYGTSSGNYTQTLPSKTGTIALTADLTTYAFAEGTNNGEIKITPSVGGTAGTAVTVKPKGISDLAYIAKGSGSSKFLREDGTWQTVTVTGAVTGVKGNSESSYRTGNVNLTPANIGAVNKTGDSMSGSLTLPSAYFNTNSRDVLNIWTSYDSSSDSYSCAIEPLLTSISSNTANIGNDYNMFTQVWAKELHGTAANLGLYDPNELSVDFTKKVYAKQTLENNHTSIPTGAAIFNRFGTGLDTNLYFGYVYNAATSINTITMTIKYSGYRTFTGLVFTRFGVAAINFYFNNAISSYNGSVTKLSGSDNFTYSNAGYNASAGTASFRVKASNSWNSFYVIGAFNNPTNVYSVITGLVGSAT